MRRRPGPTRRSFLGGAASAVAAVALPGCALPVGGEPLVVDPASGQRLSQAALLRRLRDAEFVLLGELHDNAEHHAARARLILSMSDTGVTVVAEHLDRGARVGPGADSLSRLAAAGFNATAWRWPLHESLFAPLLAAGVPVLGGNAPAAAVRRVAREGADAWPADLKPLRDAVPLSAAAQQALDQDLIEGHCGQLPTARVPALREAQVVRDASLWQALAEAPGRWRVLVAGNGHVRHDYGVARFAVASPQRRCFSVGFFEDGDDPRGAPYDAVWISPRAKREDPCAGMKPMR